MKRWLASKGAEGPTIISHKGKEIEGSWEKTGGMHKGDLKERMLLQERRREKTDFLR